MAETKKRAKKLAEIKLRPMADRVIVKPIEQDEVTASGIVLPESAKEKPQRGTVLAVGPGRVEDGKRIEMDVNDGDTVIYAKYAGTEFKMDSEKYLILAEKDILARIED